MNNPSFFELLNDFQMLRVRFFLKLNDDMYLPEFSGSTLHGFLGRALKKHDVQAYKYCYEQQFKSNQPHPYAIVTNQQKNLQIKVNRKTVKTCQWHKGDIFSFDIKFFAHVSSLGMRVVEAVRKFEQTDGIGQIANSNKHCQYSVVSYCSMRGDQMVSGIQSFSLLNHINPYLLDTKNYLISTPEIIVHLNSPLRLQQRNNQGDSCILHSAPSLDKVVYQIETRWKYLNQYWNNGTDEFWSSVNKNLPELNNIENKSTVSFHKLERYSANNKSLIPYGGLLGQLKYQLKDNNKADIIPWLAVGQQLQIGGKTTFGLGDYSLIS